MRIHLTLAVTVWSGISQLPVAGEIPSNFRIQVRTIATSPANADAILKLPSSTNARHADACRLISGKDAQLLHTSSVVARLGENSSLNMGFMHAHHREDPPRGIPMTVTPPGKPPPFHNPLPRPVLPAAMEYRQVGLSISLNALQQNPDSTYNAQIALQWVTLGEPKVIAKCIDEWGDGSMKTPVFHETTTGPTVTLKTGQFSLVSVAPYQTDAPPPVPLRKVLIFVRLDMIAD